MKKILMKKKFMEWILKKKTTNITNKTFFIIFLVYIKMVNKYYQKASKKST